MHDLAKFITGFMFTARILHYGLAHDFSRAAGRSRRREFLDGYLPSMFYEQRRRCKIFLIFAPLAAAPPPAA